MLTAEQYREIEAAVYEQHSLDIEALRTLKRFVGAEEQRVVEPVAAPEVAKKRRMTPGKRAAQVVIHASQVPVTESLVKSLDAMGLGELKPAEAPKPLRAKEVARSKFPIRAPEPPFASAGTSGMGVTEAILKAIDEEPRTLLSVMERVKELGHAPGSKTISTILGQLRMKGKARKDEMHFWHAVVQQPPKVNGAVAAHA